MPLSDPDINAVIRSLVAAATATTEATAGLRGVESRLGSTEGSLHALSVHVATMATELQSVRDALQELKQASTETEELRITSVTAVVKSALNPSTLIIIASLLAHWLGTTITTLPITP